MTNTQKYYQLLKEFRKVMQAINEKFDPAYRDLERYKDSENYQAAKQEIDNMRQGLVEKARQKATKELYAIVDAMRQTYEEKPAKAPTQEQLAVLQALKMRDSVSKDELREALNTVKGCPMAERVVGEIAAKHHHILGMQQELTGDTIRKSIDAMKRNGEKLIARLERPGEDRRKAVNEGNWDLFRLDVDTADSEECLRVFGNVTDFQRFSAAVNKEGE
jgi:exonuclease VII large subunit